MQIGIGLPPSLPATQHVSPSPVQHVMQVEERALGKPGDQVTPK